MNKVLQNLFLSTFAGISISLGGLLFLLIPNSIIGAIFFSVGLFLVLTRGYNLFTGKVAYLPDNKKIPYIFYLIIMWLGNFLGTTLISLTIRYSSLYNKVFERVSAINISKTSQGHLSAFILAILCGVIIYLAVENYKTNKHEIGKYIGIFILIPLFIICGFEHCVADMFYFSLTNDLILDKVIYLVIITLGNSIGSILSNIVMRKNKLFKNND